MRNPIQDFTGRRAFFFRDNFRRLVLICFILLLVDSGLLGYVYYQAYTMPESDLYVSTFAGDLVPLSPREDPDNATLARPTIISDAF